MEYNLRADYDDLVDTFGNTLVDAELALEARMVTVGKEQVRKAVHGAQEKGNESGTGYGKTLIAMSVVTISEGIQAFIAKAKEGGAGRRHIAVKYLEQVDSEVAAFIAMRTVVDGISGRRQMLQRIAVQIGSRIEDEARFATFKKNHAKPYARGLERAKKGSSYHRKKATMSGFERRFSEDDTWVNWPEPDRLHIGTCIIDMIVSTDLVELGEHITTRKNTLKVLQPTEKLAQWIEREVNKSELLTPAHMPMVMPPLSWTNPFNGGYLTKGVTGRMSLVKTKNTAYLSELSDKAETMPMVYDSINSLQLTRWQINASVHSIATELWERGLDVAKLPSREDVQHVPCPQCGEVLELPKTNTRGSVEHGCFEEPEVVRQWKKNAYKTHSKNVSLRSKRVSTAKTLKIADTYSEYEAIYFPYQLDFRGRIYAIPTFNPQGTDLTKGLLRFADAKPIADGVAAGWLAIQGANVYGFDKASLEDRISWVEDHQDEILDVAADPLSSRFWHDADKPWQFLAFCFEWAGFVKEGYGFMSAIAVALDGSCSGIQHFSAMLRDSVGGAAVNLIPSEKPSDIYQEVCNRVIGKLEGDLGLSSTIAKGSAKNSSSSPEVKDEKLKSKAIATGDLAEGWLSLNPDRSSTKRQVMTLPYGATRYSCREYTEEWMKGVVEDEAPWGEENNFVATQYMSEIIWDSISEVVVAARDAMDWLQKCAKVVAEEELPVYWTTASGFPIMQKYNKFASKRVKTKLGETVIKLSLQEEQDNMDKRRMASAISPNFVHGQDATHLNMSVCYAAANDIDAFAMIHDSFGTHAADTNMLAACLREAFVDLYKDRDVLADFKEQILRQVEPENQKKIPELPAKGDLDIDCVRSSDFFFA